MKTITKITVILVLILMIGIDSCRKFEEFPDEPVIKYENFLVGYNPSTGITERGVLIISYTDGNGDIGLDDDDIYPPYNPGSEYYYNMVIDYFEMQNGEFVEVPLVWWDPVEQKYDTLTFNSRIPVLIPKIATQAIKGTIQDTLFIYNPLSDFDTIKFSVYIIDRALNKSNVVETPPIIRISDPTTNVR